MNIIFNLFKIKFTKLDELLNKYGEGINPNSKINLFINLEPIIRKLSASNIEEYLKVRTHEKSYEMIANIINLAAHYRLFFTKNKLYSNIYLYLGYPFNAPYLNREINPNYRKDYSHKYTKDDRNFVLSNTLDSVLSLTKIILDYVMGVHLITSDSIEPSLIPDIITGMNKNNNINFILSNDRYDYQYVNSDFRILRAKQNDSYLINKDNVIEILKQEEKISNNITVSNNFLTFILSLLGDKHRGIGKLRGIGLAAILKMLDKAIKEELIGANAYSINVLERIVKDDYLALLRSNFLCTDIRSQAMRLNIRTIHAIADQIVDKFDNVALKRLNDEYFRQFPIHLLELTDANKLITTKKSKDIFL